MTELPYIEVQIEKKQLEKSTVMFLNYNYFLKKKYLMQADFTLFKCLKTIKSQVLFHLLNYCNNAFKKNRTTYVKKIVLKVISYLNYNLICYVYFDY